MDHYDLDYEMAIAFRAEIIARLQKRISRIEGYIERLQPPPKRNNKPSDRGTDGVS